MIDFLKWWLAISLFALAALPISTWALRRLSGHGYAFSKALGLLLVSYVLWVGSVTGILVNDQGGLVFALLCVAGISTWMLFFKGWRTAVERVKQFWNMNRADILIVEVLFLLTFAGWTIVRAYAPDKILSSGGEKYMEIAFLNGVLNSSSFPPLDPWLSGFGISYYYFGYVMMDIMTRITGSIPTVAFDLYDALLFALTAISAFGVVASMVPAAGGKKPASQAAGLLGALFVTFLGNLQGLVEGLYSSRSLPESFWQWLNIPGLVGSAQSGNFYPGNYWWWWRGSRILNDLDLFYQPVIYPPIDEFPFFSFLLGDNHPHKLALPFVLLCIGLAFNLLMKERDRTEQSTPVDTHFIDKIWAQRQEIAFYGLNALALGSLGFLNTWDMPIYLVVLILAYLAGNYSRGEPIHMSLLWRTLRVGIGMGIGAILLYIFFYLGFSSQAGGVLPYVFPPTRLAQYFVMFGPFLYILAFFLILVCRKSGDGTDRAASPWSKVLNAWVWIAGALYIVYLLALLAGVLILTLTSGQAMSFILSWMGGLSLDQALLKSLAARVTDPWHFLVVSGLMALAVAAFLGRQTEGHPQSVLSTQENETDRAAKTHAFLPPPTLFALILAFAGLGLTLSVEFFYLRDLFGMRMNTVFKFYYQGWVLMACAGAYAFWWVLHHTTGPVRSIFLSSASVLVAAALLYPLMATYSRLEGFSYAPVMDAAATLAGNYSGHWAAPDDWAAIQWINQNLRPDPPGDIPVILEAPGRAYEHYGRISAFTGLPTLLGWQDHEGQWRGNEDETKLRLPDIQTIYTTPSEEEALGLLQKWNVRYLILGEPERQFINKTCSQPETSCSPARALAKFDRFLTPIYSQQGVTIYSVY